MRFNYFASSALVMFLLCSAAFSAVGPKEYRLGDLAAENIVTPVSLRVENPDASEMLKQRAAIQVPLIFRHLIPAADEAEADLRAGIAAARSAFLTSLQHALHDRAPNGRDVDSPAYLYTVRVAGREIPNAPPLARLAPLWVRGVSDEAFVNTLLQPLRDVMAQPIVDDRGAEPLPVDQPIRLLSVKTMLDAPSLSDLATSGRPTTVAELSSLEWARKAMEAYFPADQEEMAQFAAAFLRPNTFPAPGLTELLRARRSDGVAATDTYAAGQIIVKAGQTIDRKALVALAALREQRLMESLLAKVDTKRASDSPTMPQIKSFGIGLVVACLVPLLILWRWGARSAKPEVLVPERTLMEPAALARDTDGNGWRARALLAEYRANRAHEAIRSGAMGWMREKIFRTLFRQRAELYSTQQMAEAEMREMEDRLEQLLIPLQGRIKAYEKRIEELEKALADRGEADRRLIDARITVAKRQLGEEQARVRNF